MCYILDSATPAHPARRAAKNRLAVARPWGGDVQETRLPDKLRHNVRLLVVEDNPADVRLVEECLRGDHLAQFQVESVARLELARQRLLEGAWDILLVDLSLPDSQGVQTVRDLVGRYPHLPLVVLTSSDDQELALEALRAGAQDFLVKGEIDPEDLGRSLRYAMERHRTLRQELGMLGRVSADPDTSITSGLFGVKSLKEGAPKVYGEMLDAYASLLTRSMEEQAVKVEEMASEGLQLLAQRLGHMRAGPRDVVGLHTEALKRLTESVRARQVRAYVNEGRMMVLKLMGYLVSYYRYQSLGAGRSSAGSQPRRRNEEGGQ